MMRSRLLAGAAAAALALSAAALAVAQDAQPRPWRAQMQERMQARREQALADLRQVLRLRPDQEAAFQALQAALRPPARPAPEARPAGGLTTPEMIARRARRFAAMKTEMDRRDQAVLAFYGALSSEQQKTFDALVRLRREEALPGAGPHLHVGGLGRMGGMGPMGVGRGGAPGGPPR